MGLFGRKATTVGLDIGSGLIKLVAISHASGGPVLTKVAFTSIGNDAIVEGEIMDPGIVAEAMWRVTVWGVRRMFARRGSRAPRTQDARAPFVDIRQQVPPGSGR